MHQPSHRHLLREDGPLVRERAASATSISEAGRLLETDGAANRKMIQIITPGWGSSGYYSPAVLEAASRDKVIPAGTHMYLNHASESEHSDRPERDVEKIAAVLVEDATWDGTRLTAPADLMGPHAELIESLAPYIGVSISGSATDITIGEAEGRTGPIIEGLAHVESVDFVTRAGRGGAILLESARPSLVNARAVEAGLSEATVNDTREALTTLLRDTYGGQDVYVWVRDFDDTTVWFEVEDSEGSGIYGQDYTATDTGAVALVGDWTEVRIVTSYVPADQPALAGRPTSVQVSIAPTTEAAQRDLTRYVDQQVGLSITERRLSDQTTTVTATRPGSTTTTQESKEDTMPQIEEARLRQLEADAGRVRTLESELSTEKARGDKAEQQLAERDRTARATTLIGERAKEAGVTFTSREVKGFLADVTLTEAGDLDEAAFTALVDIDAKAKAEEAAKGGGLVGFGESATESTQVAESAPTKTPWGRELPKGA